MSFIESNHFGRSSTRWTPAEPCECSECMQRVCDCCGQITGGEDDDNGIFFVRKPWGSEQIDICPTCMVDNASEFVTLYEDRECTAESRVQAQVVADAAKSLERS